MSMNVTSIGRRLVGDGQPCFLIAEAGSNHNGELEMALRLIDLAASTKADAVKFQLFRAQTLYSPKAGTSEYLKIARPIYDIIRDLELPYEWLPALAQRCQQAGILFLASVFDEECADRLDPFVVAHKIASYEITHLPLLEHVARKGKPLILSTGTASLDEVAESIEAIRRVGNDELLLMQCTASYPAPLESLNIRAISTMKRAFGVPVGLSDHSRDPVVGPVAAVAAGANLLEKHFTLSNQLPGPDHAFAVEPEELRRMVETVRQAERALGTGEKAVHPVEQELRQFARRSIFARRDLAAGEILDHENIAVLRCGKLEAGLPPKEYPSLLGRKTARPVRAEKAIRADDLA